jgi:ribulose-5-phosphate 4-epimerase/fuculose-1-phosphate aldolase
MTRTDWRANEDIFRLFQAVGRASLQVDMQDSHSGNMSMKFRDEQGREHIAITATGSQKGDLEPDQICYLSAGATDYGYYKASSETDIHARILNLPGVGATIHVHAKDLTIVTLDDAPKPSSPRDFVPVDPLGFYHLGGTVPVVWVSVPSGSRELADKSLSALTAHPTAVIQTHGLFARARTLKEAFFLAHIANASGTVVRLAEKLGVDLAALRAAVQAEPDSHFDARPEPYDPGPDDRCDFAEEEEIRREFIKTGARIFESRLSPFHTGSISVRGVQHMLYAPKAAMPREIGGPLLKVPLEPRDADSAEVRRHKVIYAGSDFQTILHCYQPEAEAQAMTAGPGPGQTFGRIVPVDAEGSFLYLVIPVVPAKTGAETLIRLLHDYKVVVVQGGGVWAVGHQSLSEVLHHPSSLREICLYRIGALERGLDLKRMEPAQAKRW